MIAWFVIVAILDLDALGLNILAVIRHRPELGLLGALVAAVGAGIAVWQWRLAWLARERQLGR